MSAAALGLWEEVRGSRLLRAGLWMSLAGVAGGALGYVFQVLMGRLLSPADFALFSAVMALGMFAASPLSALTMLVARQVASLVSLGHKGQLRPLYLSVFRGIVVGAVILLACAILAQDALQGYLHAPDATPIWILYSLLVVVAVVALNTAFFQGSQSLGWLGGLGVAGVLARIVFGVAFLGLGWGATGALLAVLFATLVTSLAGLARLRPMLPNSHQSAATSSTTFPLAAIVPVFVANVAFTAMTQLDMVLVNHYFDANQAGHYAAASVLGKAVLYLPGGLVIALYPMVAGRYAARQGSAHLLVQSALAVLIVCGSAATVYWLLGTWLVGLFYGAAYAPAGELLALYGWAVLPMALVMVAEHFLIAQGRVLFAWLFLAVAPLQLLVIHLWHPDLRSVILVIGAGGAVMAILGYGVLLREYLLSRTSINESAAAR